MKNRIGLAAVAATAVALSVGTGALAAGLPVTPTPPQSANGPHGCALSDVAGNSLPTLHDSSTSHIGDNHCVYYQVGTDDGTGTQGGSYFATAQTWSVAICAPVLATDSTGTHEVSCTPVASYSSANGDSPTGMHVVPVGDKVTASVSNGALIVGTYNGAPGA